MSELLDGVLLSMTAHMRYLQEEHNGLYVAGQYGNQVKSVFKSLQRNSSNLRPEDIEDLKTTVSILPAQQVNSYNQQPQPFMRGGFRSGSRFRGGFRGRGGPYHFRQNFGYQPRSVPGNRDFTESNQLDEN